ncbi:MAG: ABC transporter permease, partial [Chloroflexi bacterium]|nr:ABC transporter permease [Chloroflexota bacterium]
VSLFYIKLKDSTLGERFITRVKRIYTDLSISTTSEFADSQMMDDSLNAYVWVIAGLAIVLGGVGMMNAQLMSVYERTREIGVLRAVGWSSRRVMTMILGESLVVSAIGGILGVGIGWLAVYGLTSATVMMGASTNSIHAGLIIQAAVVVFFLGLAGGIYPAWRASQLQPVEALRYEGGTAGTNARRLPVGGMAVQSLWQRTTRTVLTLVVIGITVGSIMTLEGVIRGASASLDQLALGADAELMVRQADISDSSMSALDERTGEKIAAMPGVTSVSGLIFTAVVLPESGFFIVQGYSPHEFGIQRFRIVEGKPLQTNHQIIIGKDIAEALKKKVGENIELSGRRYRIVGIYESSVGWEQMGGVMTLRDAQTFTGRPRKVSMYSVKVDNPQQASAIVDAINQQLPDAHAALSGEFADQLPDMQNSNGIMTGISLLAIIVGGLGVLNTMLMAVLERTREIGVLRALGWRRRAVLGMIMKESLLLAILGAIAGVLIALSLGGLMGLTMGDLVTPVWDWDVFARAILIALLLGLLGGLYPAYRATRLQPIEALRYE